MSVQTSFDGVWVWKPGGVEFDENKLREEIISEIFRQGFVIDLGNGIVLRSIEEWRVFWEVYNEMVLNKDQGVVCDAC